MMLQPNLSMGSKQEPKPVTVHPLWLRLTHWLNALAVLVMVTSGWQIYNASPLFDFDFPPTITLGGWLGGALQWHFDGILLAISGLVVWKSVQFPLLRELLGGYNAARYVHFVAMAALVGFVALHLVMVALVPRTLITMLRGR